MKKQRHYITFYQLRCRYCIPYINRYGLMCTRSLCSCLALGMKHILKGTAFFFTVEKAVPKKDSYFH